MRTDNRGNRAMTTPNLLRCWLLSGLTAVVVSCAPTMPSPSASPTQAVLSQPANVGDAGIAATAYHNSGAYDRDLAAVSNEASTWVAERAPQVKKPALVLDIDDTALSNWEVIVANDFGRVIDGPCRNLPKGPCGWQEWDLLSRSTVIQPTQHLFQKARDLNVAVFFITGRPEAQRAATERNLRATGFGGYERIYMVPDGAHFASAANFKTPVREQIEQQGYTIIANMGDQPSDLAGGHAEKTFQLPNPFYRIQ
jgi:predicted secreted acid phosphatase